MEDKEIELLERFTFQKCKDRCEEVGCHDCWISVDEVEVVEKLLKKYKDLQQSNKQLNDKLKKIEEQCNTAIKNSYTYTSLHHSGVLTNAHDILEIIEGND